MEHNKIKFDIAVATEAGKSIVKYGDEIKQIQQKVTRAIDNADWWVGHSRNGYVKRMGELEESLKDAYQTINTLGKQLIDIAEIKRLQDLEIKEKLQKATESKKS